VQPVEGIKLIPVADLAIVRPAPLWIEADRTALADVARTIA